MTNRLTFILLFFTLLFNCSINEQPDFIGLENIKVLDSNIKNITISADAHFTNPNDLGGRLKTDNLKVYINNNTIEHMADNDELNQLNIDRLCVDENKCIDIILFII